MIKLGVYEPEDTKTIRMFSWWIQWIGTKSKNTYSVCRKNML